MKLYFLLRLPMRASVLGMALAISSALLAQEDPAREAAQRRFSEATTRESEARLELWRAHNEHQALWARFNAPDRDAQMLELTKTIAAAVGESRERAALEAPLRTALQTFRVGERATADLAPRVASLCGQAWRQDAEAEPEAVVRLALERIYPPAAAWIDVWNENLASISLAAKAYAVAREERLQARSVLLGAISPVATHPAAKQIPEGMVLVPGGTYTLGPAKGWTTGAASLARSVELKSFYIDRFEVTNAQYRTFLGSLPQRKAEPYYPSTWLRDESNAQPQIPEGREEFPVTGVDLVSAMAYAAWRGMRLPTEEEWEAAAAGAVAQEYPWGETYETARSNALDHLRGSTARVGEFSGDLSPFGVFDLAGNVSEWTVTLPTGEALKKAPVEGQLRNVICRGGSYLTEDPRETTSTHYRWPQPARGTQRSDLGFRCAKSARSR